MDEITQLKQEMAELKSLFYKNSFSNLYIFQTPVIFRRSVDFSQIPITTTVSTYPLDATPVATSTTDSTGRISVLIDGVTRYIPYF